MNRSRTLLTSLRLAAQWVARPRKGASAADVIRHMTAMQAQDFAGAKWSVGLRAPGLTDLDIERALASAEIVRSWPMRGTLHLVAPEDLGWMLRLTAPRLIRGARLRREQLGLSDNDVERARAIAQGALSGGRVLTRDAIQSLWNEHGIETTGQRGYHLLVSLSQTGTLVFGPVDAQAQTFVLLDEWVPNPRELDGDEALGEWARRYFASHGPATVRDFAWWASLTLTEARRGVAVAQPRELEVEGVTYYLADDLEPAGRGVFLLPGFDEYLLGYQDRSAPLAAEHAALTVPGNNGVFQPTIVANGEVVGLWKRPLGRRAFEYAPFGALPVTARAEKAYAAYMAARHPDRLRLVSYAPYPLVSDAAALGLIETTVSNPLGSAVARHRVTRTSTRATIFLHGAAGSWTTWTPLLAAAAEAGIVIRNPVLLDMPGWGDGTLTDNRETHTIETICGLVKDVAEELGYTEWDIIGHSMGGFIALHMASIWPQCVLSVGMVSGTTWSVIDSVDHPVRNFGVLPAFTMLWRVMRGLARWGESGAGVIRFAQRVRLLRTAVFPLFRHPYRVDPTVIASLSTEVRPVSFAAAAEFVRGYDADAHWRGVSCPIRACRGDSDTFVRAVDLDRLLAIQPDAVVTVIDNCGHFAAVERPAETLEALGLH